MLYGILLKFKNNILIQWFSTILYIHVPPTQFENIYVPFDHFFAFFSDY